MVAIVHCTTWIHMFWWLIHLIHSVLSTANLQLSKWAVLRLPNSLLFILLSFRFVAVRRFVLLFVFCLAFVDLQGIMRSVGYFVDLHCCSNQQQACINNIGWNGKYLIGMRVSECLWFALLAQSVMHSVQRNELVHFMERQRGKMNWFVFYFQGRDCFVISMADSLDCMVLSSDNPRLYHDRCWWQSVIHCILERTLSVSIHTLTAFVLKGFHSQSSDYLAIPWALCQQVFAFLINHQLTHIYSHYIQAKAQRIITIITIENEQHHPTQAM